MTESDLSVLRERAENGDATAVDILIELAGERGDMDELRRLATTAAPTRPTSSSKSPPNSAT